MDGLFSERCIEQCMQSRILGQDNQAGLLQLGVGTCPGPTMPPNNFCSFTGEVMEPLAAQHEQIPSSMIYDAVVGIMCGEITVGEIPDPTIHPDVLVARWGALMCRLDEIRFPGQHYDPAEALPGKIPQ